jgi:tetratricopeptide (TPR) repeat protein
MDALPELTRRERDVLVALCAPLRSDEVFAEPASVREIARALVVTDAAVKQHLLNLYDKFGIGATGGRRRVMLAKEASKRGAVDLPPPAPGQSPLDAGGDAFGRQDWDTAWQLLFAADAAAPLEPADLEKLGEAGFWTNRHEQALSVRQRAYQSYLRADELEHAAFMALVLTIHYVARMDFAVARGWYAKAERLLETLPESFAHGHFAFVSALFAEASGDWPAVRETAGRLYALGCRCGEADLQALGLAFQGLAETHLEEVAHGTKLLDEAMASATAGELTTFAAGIIYCRMLCACLDLQDFSRAGQWTDVIRANGPPAGLGGLPGDCRTHRAAVLAKRGNWDEGLHEAELAIAENETFYMPHMGIAAREAGQIRLLLGDLSGAEEAFVRAHGLGVSPEPGLSLLRLKRGDADAAASAVQTALAEAGEDRLGRARLLSARVEIALAQGDVADAGAAVAELEETADRYGSAALGAAAEHTRGALELASGNADQAAASLASAQRLWLRVEAPYDAARAGELLGEAHLARGQRDAGILELRAAATAFDRLGATLDAQRTADRLAQLSTQTSARAQKRGQPPRRGARSQ